MEPNSQLRPAYPVQTARLSLRPLTPADTESLMAYRGLPEVCRFVPFEPMDADAIRQRFESHWNRTHIDAEGQALALGFELRRSGGIIGDVLLQFESALHGSGEVGWMLNPGYSGNGYATEAAHGLLHLAFDGLGLHRVIARVHVSNLDSRRLALRLGMRQEALLVRNEWFKGEWGSEADFALLREEWIVRHRTPLSSCPWPDFA